MNKYQSIEVKLMKKTRKISLSLGIYNQFFLRHTDPMLTLQNNTAKGFSLVEVLVSVLILAGLISIVVQLSYGNTRRMRKSLQLEKIASLLELKMLDLEEEFKGEKISDLPEQGEGEFENEKHYFWGYKTQPLALPPLETLLSLIQLPKNELNIKMVNTLINVLSGTVVELKLTVHYGGGREKPLSYSLVSYFVNYEDAPDFIFNEMKNLLPESAGL